MKADRPPILRSIDIGWTLAGLAAVSGLYVGGLVAEVGLNVARASVHVLNRRRRKKRRTSLHYHGEPTYTTDDTRCP